MHGKYHDTRAYQHLVHTYSRVPYQDNEIFNLQKSHQHQIYLADNRAQFAATSNPVHI